MPRKNFSKSEPRSTPTDTHDNPVVAAMSLFVRWARRELHGQTVAQSGIDIDRSAATILGALYFHEPVRLSDLADHLGLDRSTISRQVAAAFAQGWVRRDGDTRDARAAMLTLSARGHEVRRKLANTFEAICDDLLSSWNQADRFRSEGVY